MTFVQREKIEAYGDCSFWWIYFFPATLRLAKAFGVSADFWMNIQLRWDLYFAQKAESDALNEIKPLHLGHLTKRNSTAQPGAGH